MNLSPTTNLLANPTLVKSKYNSSFPPATKYDTHTKRTEKNKENKLTPDKKREMMFLLGTLSIATISTLALLRSSKQQKKLISQINYLKRAKGKDVNSISAAAAQIPTLDNSIWLDIKDSCKLDEMALSKGLGEKAKK